ncbi:MAG TPA: Hsp70 family protein [Polyangiaceae bacterium]|nr:Hsp70 family protein [Polyangiaceae bacterium]
MSTLSNRFQSHERPSVYAIDFGTTNSLIAAANSTTWVRALPIDPGASDPTVFRSILHFDFEGRASFGARALERYRQLGMQGRLVRSLKRHLPSKSFVTTEVDGKSYRLEELVGGILRALRERANAHFDCDVTRVLLGRPARFSEDPADDALAEARLTEAARLAGFTQISLCPEPLAAAYDFQEHLAEPKLVMIADLGGGTSDFSLIRMSRHGYRDEDVLGTGGVSVAGDALDGALMQHHIARHFGAHARYRAPFGKNELTMPLSLVHKLYSSVDMSLLSQREVLEFLRRVRDFSVSEPDRAAVERLLVAAEDALGFHVYEAIEHVKRELAEPAPGLGGGSAGATFHFDYPEVTISETVDGTQFEVATQKAVAAIVQSVEDLLERAQTPAVDVDVLCCTGGTAKVHLIANRLRALFPNAQLHSLSSFRAVVDGLARRAQQQLHG